MTKGLRQEILRKRDLSGMRNELRKALKGDGKCLTGYSFMLSAVISLKIQIPFRLSFKHNKSKASINYIARKLRCLLSDLVAVNSNKPAFSY